MQLIDTVELMLSDDYKERFKGEYYQVKERYERLRKMVVRYQAGTLNFESKCDLELLKSQLSAMRDYIYILEVRAQIEGIEL